MSHACDFVIVPGDGDADDRVRAVLAPHRIDEDREDGPYGLWDGWIVGGRCSGLFTGYDPYADPARRAICFVCNGTGWRGDDIGTPRRALDDAFRCNGCSGSGWRLRPTTEWPRHMGDVVDSLLLADLLPELADVEMPEHVVSARTGLVISRAGKHTSAEIRSAFGRTLVVGIAAGRAERVVVVDLHS